MVLYGASGHGKVIRDILASLSMPVRCYLDDNTGITEFDGLPVYHSTEGAGAADGEDYIISIGNNAIRKRLAETLSLRPISAIHTSACFAASVRIGEGTVAMANSTVNPDCTIGRHCIINTNASIDHDGVLEDYVHISPNAALAGNVTVREGAHVGIGACVTQGITIGRWAMVGAGAVVIRDVPDFAVVVGNPARIIRYDNR